MSSDLLWRWSRFEELDAAALYEILRLRQEVFVVEQACAYLDADGRDAGAWHLTVHRNRQLGGYLRLLLPDTPEGELIVGRIVTALQVRGTGIGRQLVERAIAHAAELAPGSPLAMSAQAHLMKFYRGLGFEPEGPRYDEDGIEHIRMVRRAN